MLPLILYSSAVSATIGLGVLLVERYVSARRLATRWLWLAALGAMVVVTLFPATRQLDGVTAGPEASAPASGTTSGPTAAGGPTPSSRAPRQVSASEAVSVRRAATADVALLALWFVLSAAG